MPFVQSIPIGMVYSVYDTLCDGLPEHCMVRGCYRDFKKLLVCLGKYYLSWHSGFEVRWFREEYLFYVALGGDGPPFGKDDMRA